MFLGHEISAGTNFQKQICSQRFIIKANAFLQVLQCADIVVVDNQLFDGHFSDNVQSARTGYVRHTCHHSHEARSCRFTACLIIYNLCVRHCSISMYRKSVVVTHLRIACHYHAAFHGFHRGVHGLHVEDARCTAVGNRMSRFRNLCKYQTCQNFYGVVQDAACQGNWTSCACNLCRNQINRDVHSDTVDDISCSDMGPLQRRCHADIEECIRFGSNCIFRP